MFFFEKKNQKTFSLCARCRRVCGKHPKVFWFFFSKKNCFLPYVSSGTNNVPVRTVLPAKSASVSIRQLPPARISLGRNRAL